MYDIEKTWPKWKIVRLIGEGSFGKVFEIYRNEFGIEEHSALKVISIPQSDSEVQSLKNDGMTDSDTSEYFKGIVSDFVQEIQLMSQLKGNSNVVAYEDFAVIEKTDSVGFEILIRMELLTGLPKYLRENHFRVIDVIQLGIDMCKALEVCRELNIVHRDIKPDNIFVSANGSYKLGDFGVARTIEKTMAGLSRKGTYSYMAPEIYNGQEYGFEADIYSLGIVLYKLLNNNRDPFLPAYPAPVKYSDKTEAMVKRIQGLPLSKPDNADEQLSKIILKACAHKTADRYQYPKELRLDLEAIASGYRELQSEVFSENGINYYTNNSIFGTSNGKPATDFEQKPCTEDSSSQEVVEDDDEGTMVMTESTEDEGTMVMTDEDSNIVFGTTDIAENENKVNGTANVVPSIEEEPPAVVHVEMYYNPALLCPACRRPVKEGSFFCGHCGQNLGNNKPQSILCPTCGFEMKLGVKFCGKCGTKL